MKEMEFEREQEIIDACMFNTYAFITEQLTFPELLEEDEPWLLYVPSDDDDYQREEAIKSLIEYYTEREEYEKCQDLVDLE
jgi:hypothetical protein